jgi:hypothetical protein
VIAINAKRSYSIAILSACPVDRRRAAINCILISNVACVQSAATLKNEKFRTILQNTPLSLKQTSVLFLVLLRKRAPPYVTENQNTNDNCPEGNNMPRNRIHNMYVCVNEKISARLLQPFSFARLNCLDTLMTQVIPSLLSKHRVRSVCWPTFDEVRVGGNACLLCRQLICLRSTTHIRKPSDAC